MVGAERLEEEKASDGSFFDDRRSFVILRVAAGADISKSYETSDRSELGLGRRLTKQDELPREFEPLKYFKENPGLRKQTRLKIGGR